VVEDERQVVECRGLEVAHPLRPALVDRERRCGNDEPDHDHEHDEQGA
jgi:hypothetical protein